MSLPPTIKSAVVAHAWVEEYVRPMVVSLAAQGDLDGLEAMELLEGLDNLRSLVGFIRKHHAAIKAAAGG